MKVIEQHVPVLPFIILHIVILTLKSEKKSLSATIQMKATEQYFPVVLFIMLYKVVLTFESMNEILKCVHFLKATEQYFPLVLLMLSKVVLTFASLECSQTKSKIIILANHKTYRTIQ